ncbi:non-canonical purine NTP pyrophosphatase, partial [Escherichia coli]
MNIRFITRNRHKIKEINKILSDTGVVVLASEHSIDEIQTENVHALIKDKLLKAFK